MTAALPCQPHLAAQASQPVRSCCLFPFLQNAARRNVLLAHVGAALRQLQQQLDALDAFVAHHFKGPWAGAGLGDSGRHWLDTVAR